MSPNKLVFSWHLRGWGRCESLEENRLSLATCARAIITKGTKRDQSPVLIVPGKEQHVSLRVFVGGEFDLSRDQRCWVSLLTVL